jgi:capsular exopolysaccharide synthesis family protein
MPVDARNRADHGVMDRSLVARGGDADIWDHLRTAVRHRWWALAGFVLLGAPLAVITLTTTPVFQAQTRLLVSGRAAAGNSGLVERSAEQGERQGLDPQTLTEVVRSRALARATITRTKLWTTAEFAPLVADASSDDERSVRLIDPLLGRLSAGIVPDTQVLVIGFEATDPAVAARVVNEVAKTFIERDRESLFSTATAAADWLTTRLAEQRKQVAASETALQEYRARFDALSLSERQNIVVQRLADLNASVTRAKTDRIGRETQYRIVQPLKNNPGALESNPLVAASPLVQTLKTQVGQLARQDAELSNRLGPKHPERVQVATALESTQDRLHAELAKVVAGIESDYQAAVASEESLTQALNQQKSEAFSLDRKGVEYAALEREAVSARQIYDALLQQTKEAAMTSELQQSAMRVVDTAEPPSAPVRPKRGQGLAAAAVMGILGGAAGAAGREYMRRRVASPRDVEQRLGLPLLALVPRSPGKEADTISGLSPLPAEAFRRLRANVMMGCGDQQLGNIVLVTSAAPGEGKSFVSSHLALSLAAVDQRVALIDADLRRPRLHTAFDRQRAPGLSDVLLGRRSTAEVLRPVGTQGLALVPSGIPTKQAAELLSLQSFRTFLQDLRSDFDWIVIDSPPVMAVADAAVLAHDATGVLFVTSADDTSLEAADSALSELHAAGARMIGAVLNRAPFTREAFYYSRYYRPEYDSYLMPDEAEAPPVEATLRS